jgi:hypothetical protein
MQPELKAAFVGTQPSEHLIAEVCRRFRSIKGDISDELIAQLKSKLPQLRETDPKRYHKASSMLAVANMRQGRQQEARSYLNENGARIESITYLRSRVRAADFGDDLRQLVDLVRESLNDLQRNDELLPYYKGLCSCTEVLDYFRDFRQCSELLRLHDVAKIASEISDWNLH